MLPVPPPFTNLSSIPSFCIAFTICSLLFFNLALIAFNMKSLPAIDSVYGSTSTELHTITPSNIKYDDLSPTINASCTFFRLCTPNEIERTTTHINIQTNTKTSFRFQQFFSFFTIHHTSYNLFLC